MNKRDKVRVEQIDRTGKFVIDNEADFETLPPAAKTTAMALATPLNAAGTGLLARLEKFEVGRETGNISFHSGTTSKATLRHGIVLTLMEWLETAGTIAARDETPEIMSGFRVPHGVKAEEFAAKATAIVESATAIEQKFLDLGYPADFLQDMTDRIEAFEKAKDDKSAGLGKQVGSHTGLSDAIREGTLIGRQLNTIFNNLYRTNPAKLAEWATAFHTERVGSGKSDDETPVSAPAAP